MRLSALSLLILASVILLTSAKIEEGIVMSSSPRSWPQLVGMDGEAAKAQLEQEYPEMRVQVVPYGSMVTMDYREDRIRIYVDEAGKVQRAPTVG